MVQLKLEPNPIYFSKFVFQQEIETYIQWHLKNFEIQIFNWFYCSIQFDLIELNFFQERGMNQVEVPSLRLLRKLDTNIFSLFPQISGLFMKHNIKPFNTSSNYFMYFSSWFFTSKYIYRDIFVWYFRMDEAYLTYYLIWSNLILFGKY